MRSFYVGISFFLFVHAAIPSLSHLFVHLGCELGVVLLEAVADALLRGHPLLDAAVDAAAFPVGNGLGGEVIDAGHEAVLDKTAESTHKLLDLALLHALLKSALLGG